MARIKKEFHLRFNSGPDSRSASEEKARHTVNERISALETKTAVQKTDTKKHPEG